MFCIHVKIQAILPKISYPKIQPKQTKTNLEPLADDVFIKSPTFKASCSTGNFALKKYPEIACGSCGKHMVTSDDIEEIGFDIQGTTGKKLISVLDKYKGLYRPLEEEIVQDIKYIATRNKNLKIDEIVQCMNKVYINELRQEQRGILAQLKEIAGKANSRDKKIIERFVTTSENLIYLESEDKFFKRKTFIRKLEEIAAGIKNQEVAKEMVELAHKLPASSDSRGAFFAKYSRRSEREIAQRLITPSLVTVEHIKPQSLGGADDTSNYILECGSCNSRRGNMPYIEWFKRMPEMPENLQKYIKVASKVIEREKIEGYESYIDDIITTFKTETKGEVKLRKPRASKK